MHSELASLLLLPLPVRVCPGTWATLPRAASQRGSSRRACALPSTAQGPTGGLATAPTGRPAKRPNQAQVQPAFACLCCTCGSRLSMRYRRFLWRIVTWQTSAVHILTSGQEHQGICGGLQHANAIAADPATYPGPSLQRCTHVSAMILEIITRVASPLQTLTFAPPRLPPAPPAPSLPPGRTATCPSRQAQAREALGEMPHAGRVAVHTTSSCASHTSCCPCCSSATAWHR